MDQETQPSSTAATTLPTAHHTGLNPRDWGAIWVATFIIIVFVLTYIITWIRKALVIDKQLPAEETPMTGGSSYSPVFTESLGLDTMDGTHAAPKGNQKGGKAGHCGRPDDMDCHVEMDPNGLCDGPHTDHPAADDDAIVVTIENETLTTQSGTAADAISANLTASSALTASPQLTSVTVSPTSTAVQNAKSIVHTTGEQQSPQPH